MKDNRIFWFLRKKDNKEIPIQGADAGCRIIKQPYWQMKFEYLGWSDQKAFNDIIQKQKKMTPAEHKKLVESGEQIPEHKEVLKEAWAAELAAAKANPDKSYPKHATMVDMNGNPITSGPLHDTINLMGQK